MKKSRFTVEQIIGVLRETQAGATVKEVCAKHNIADQTYYGWKRKYGGMEVDEARRLKGLEEENQRLKRPAVRWGWRGVRSTGAAVSAWRAKSCARRS